jgi:hypothetical protein
MQAMGNGSAFDRIRLAICIAASLLGLAAVHAAIGIAAVGAENAKWQSGSQTVLASQSSYTFANGNSFAVVDQGSAVSAWANTGSGFSQLLSASDSSFSSGKPAVEGSGNITRLTNFKAGTL